MSSRMISLESTKVLPVLPNTPLQPTSGAPSSWLQ